MTRIELAPEVGDDLKRIADHLIAHDAANVEVRITEIIHAIEVLALNPLIGRPCVDELRELIIGRDAKGYLALYRYFHNPDIVLVLAIRSQLEAGYENV